MINSTAAIILYPYLAWITTAAALSINLFIINFRRSFKPPLEKEKSLTKTNEKEVKEGMNEREEKTNDEKEMNGEQIITKKKVRG